MKTLIVEDDFTSSLLLRELLKNYGPSQIAVNDMEAVKAVRVALKAGEPYDLICLDVMMPGMDGQTALKQIRELEKKPKASRPTARRRSSCARPWPTEGTSSRLLSTNAIATFSNPSIRPDCWMNCASSG